MAQKRQLVAILFADVQGFSALVQQDEDRAWLADGPEPPRRQPELAAPLPDGGEGDEDQTPGDAGGDPPASGQLTGPWRATVPCLAGGGGPVRGRRGWRRRGRGRLHRRRL